MQSVAGKAATLVKVLGKLEETCEAVAAFWTMEADKFDSQGAKMKTSQVKMLEGMKGSGQEQHCFLENRQRRDRLLRYGNEHHQQLLQLCN